MKKFNLADCFLASLLLS